MKVSYMSFAIAAASVASAISLQWVPFVETIIEQPLAKEELNSKLIDLHRKLVEIPSVSGTEEKVGEFLKEYLENLDYTVETQVLQESPKQFNIYAYPGQKRETRVLLTSHIDTVPPFFPYRVQGDKIYGRGAVDAKNCVASQISAVEELRAVGEIDEGDVALLFVVEEETNGAGMKFANRETGVESWETVIFGEPTELKLGVGHKGIAMASYSIHGKASHSGYPELGVSANEILVDLLNELLETKWPVDDLLGTSTFNIGKISGGVAGNVVPAEAGALVSVRIASDYDFVVSKMKQVAESRSQVNLDSFYSMEPQYLSYDVPGFDSIILKYGTDIPNLDGNFTKNLYGPGSIHQAHGAEEHITFSDLIDSVDGYKRLIKQSLS
ncbi:hypothetical protein TRVA0_001S10638 [Trichomonascus vanleenenianus]|uniref:M20 family metallopeptidase n=1 Tax=Trichomonascus vanleenenianus TaxID=2268995 RepID=UPI003EC9DADB